MAVNQAQIAADIAHIYTDLGSTDAEETASFYQPDGTTLRGTGSVIRGIHLSATQLRDSGFADVYEESIYVQTADNPGIAREDVITLANGNFRVMKVAPGPMSLIVRCDLGDRWE
jgi:hypothetical protein